MTTDYDNTALKASTLAKEVGLDESSLRKYARGVRQPREKNAKKFSDAMQIAQKNPALRFHPSYGYATDEQISELKRLGSGPRFNYLLSQIEKQTKARGRHFK